MKPKICIDAGHGGHDSGAVGPKGLRESDIALGVALRLANLLQNDCEVVMTRRTDVFLTLTRRAEIANQSGADAFLSIHCNSGPPGQGAGFEVWTSPGQTAADRMATELYNAYADKFPMKPRRFDMSDGDVDKESAFTVLMKTRMPAVLFELEFIHTAAGEAWLADPANHARCAEALAEGLRDYLGIGGFPVPEPEPERPPLEVEMLAALDRAGEKTRAAFETARTEIEALFRE